MQRLRKRVRFTKSKSPKTATALMRKYNLQRKAPDESVAEKLETLVKDGHSPFYKFKKDGAHVFTNVK